MILARDWLLFLHEERVGVVLSFTSGGWVLSFRFRWLSSCQLVCSWSPQCYSRVFYFLLGRE